MNQEIQSVDGKRQEDSLSVTEIVEIFDEMCKEKDKNLSLRESLSVASLREEVEEISVLYFICSVYFFVNIIY